MKKNPVTKYDSKKIPKTGDWRFLSPKVDKEKCTACGICVKFCPEATIELAASGKSFAKIDYDFCKGCGVCAAVCPSKAIIMQKLK